MSTIQISSAIQTFLKDLERETVTTRKMLERVPEDKFSWQPHPKSMTLKRLATHIAELPGWIALTLTTNELDFQNVPPQYQQRDINTTAGLLEYLEETYAAGKAELEKADEASLVEDWTLRSGDQVFSVEPKAEVIRMALNQTVHHRAQLGVFLRLLDVPIPGSYGPSADEMEF